VVSISAGILSN